MERAFNLCDLIPGQRATVVSLQTDAEMKRRLLDIGLIPGTSVDCVGQSPGKALYAYRICGAIIAIRRQDGENIRMTAPCGGGAF